jgi:protein gp37
VGRFHKAGWGPHAKRVRSAASTWKQPLAWERKAVLEGTRPFVFCSELSDVFDNQVPPEWRRDLFVLIRATPHLTWLLLTKRPQNIARLYAETGQPGDMWPRNAAIGCTVVTQAEADRDIPHLMRAKLALKPAFTFLSLEPLMGAVDLRAALHGEPHIDWVITGGESKQGKHLARPSHPDWFRSIRDRCAAAGVPYHHKQNGEYLGGERVGKTRAGRTLDGVIHDARPSTDG